MSYRTTDALLTTAERGPLRLLIVDDEEVIRRGLQTWLTKRGYDVRVAANGEEAFSLLSHHSFACLLLDVHLGKENGIQLVPRVLEVDPDAAIVMLSSVNDAPDAALCMQRGALDFLVKPLDLTELDRAVRRALRLREERIEAQLFRGYLKEEISQIDRELAQERDKLSRLTVATLESLASVQEAGDPYLAGHSMRVAEVAASIAAQMERSDEEVESVRLAGRLHDIGKIVIPSKVLAKQGPLDKEEYELVKRHVVVGYQILAPLPHLEEVARFVRGHHERWDGGGYPDGLAAHAIPWGGRVLGAAEIYDALTTARPYQDRMTPEAAVARMETMVNGALAPDTFRALQAVVAARQALIFLDAPRDAAASEAVGTPPAGQTDGIPAPPAARARLPRLSTMAARKEGA